MDLAPLWPRTNAREERPTFSPSDPPRIIQRELAISRMQDPALSRSAVTGCLEKISCELVTLKAWHEDRVISAREHGQQISTLLAAKLPMPVTHSELTRSVLEALATWSRDSLVWEDIAAASVTKVSA